MGTHSGQVLFRDEPGVVEALRRQAALRGRTLTDEIRLAVRIHLREQMLAQLRDPLGRAEAEAQGFDVTADEKLLKKQLADMRREAFARPRQNLRESLQL
ncbi:MAG: hypothetical protein WKF41_09145 [Gaiellaceae bacterium]